MRLFGAILAMLMLVPLLVSAQEDTEMSNENAKMEGSSMTDGYYLLTAVKTDFATTVENVRVALKDEGFGILTEIDFSATMKAKLDKDTPPCLILGACNPPFAWEVFQSEPWIGVEMPCNAVIRQLEDGSVQVAIKNPGMLAEATGNSELKSLGEELTARVERVLAVISK